jgi:hypothetical protein
VLKPAVVAPGAGIVNARSVPDGAPDHDRDPFNGQIMDGTSMSCPNGAGSAALVTDDAMRVLQIAEHNHPSMGRRP